MMTRNKSYGGSISEIKLDHPGSPRLARPSPASCERKAALTSFAQIFEVVPTFASDNVNSEH